MVFSSERIAVVAGSSPAALRHYPKGSAAGVMLFSQEKAGVFFLVADVLFSSDELAGASPASLFLYPTNRLTGSIAGKRSKPKFTRTSHGCYEEKKIKIIGGHH